MEKPVCLANKNASHYHVIDRTGLHDRTAMTFARLTAALALATFAMAGIATAAEPEALLLIKNHRFEPAELKVPAGQRIKLTVHNQDSTAEEFESHSLNREKVVPGGAKATLYIGPLKPGRYDFFGEYHEATAKGVVIAE
jgi:plastocyanin